MTLAAKNWEVITTSTFPWEREALDYVQSFWPGVEIFHAWSNFQFVAKDGSLNEVDLLLFTPHGLFLTEIKSHHGQIRGDSQAWTWTRDNVISSLDNPLWRTDLKAKRLVARLRDAMRKVPNTIFTEPPFIEPIVFLSQEKLVSQLDSSGGNRIFFRGGDRPQLKDLLLEGKGLQVRAKGCDRGTLRCLKQGMKELGIATRQADRKVGNYKLGGLLGEERDWQDFEAKHERVAGDIRRVRIYFIRLDAPPEKRQALHAAAEREYRILSSLEHKHILSAQNIQEHPLGQAIVFKAHEKAVRLDQFLLQRKNQMPDTLRLAILRQITEAIGYAHRKGVRHRGLNPRSILVDKPDSDEPLILLHNWQLGSRSGGEDLTILPTVHLQELCGREEDLVYMAPEALKNPKESFEYHDIFSLGCLAWRLFSDLPPAESLAKLESRLRANQGLDLAAVVNGPPPKLRTLILEATNPDVSKRTADVGLFLANLEAAKDGILGNPDPATQVTPVHPTQASKDDILGDDMRVVRRLGSGSTAVAYLVDKNGDELVLKVALEESFNPRIRDEVDVLRQLQKHDRIIRLEGSLELAGHQAILMEYAGAQTLAERIREDGRISLDFLSRWGNDLLEAVAYLEKKGLPHRDIKPDNIGVLETSSNSERHLVLFDFSLSRWPVDDIRAGTPGYLDPFLTLRRRWDLHAERFAATVTLFQMATGERPKWGDGRSDPALTQEDLQIEAEQFPAVVRAPMKQFFAKALKRDVRDRFENAEEMQLAWRALFAQTHVPTITATPVTSSQITPETPLASLGLTALALDALDQINVVRACELASTSRRDIMQLRGVSHNTRRQIVLLAEDLRVRFPEMVRRVKPSLPADPSLQVLQVEELVAFLIDQVIAPERQSTRGPRRNDQLTREILTRVLCGLKEHPEDLWPSQATIAASLGKERVKVNQVIKQAFTVWAQLPEYDHVGKTIAALLERNSKVMALDELALGLMATFGSQNIPGESLQMARGLVRSVLEPTRLDENRVAFFQRFDHRILIGQEDGTDRSFVMTQYARKLGDEADILASHDPLLSPQRAMERLRLIPRPPEAESISDSRLMTLAAESSTGAALSSRQEFYLRGMSAERVLRLSQGALLGQESLEIQELQDRCNSRYPQAEKLPPRPALDALIKKVGIDLCWSDQGQCFKPQPHTGSGVSQITTDPTRGSVEIPCRAITSREKLSKIEEKLRAAEVAGAYLVLPVSLNRFRYWKETLLGRPGIVGMDLEKLFLEKTRQKAGNRNLRWDRLIEADQDGKHWSRFTTFLAQDVWPEIDQAVRAPLAAGETRLIYHMHWMARYGFVHHISGWRDSIRHGELHGLWILNPQENPAGNLPMLDREPIQALGSNQIVWLDMLADTPKKTSGPEARPNT